MHQNETLACRSTARQVRQGRLRGYSLGNARYSRRGVECRVRNFIMLVH